MKFIVCPFCKTRIRESEFPASRKRRQHIVMFCPSCKQRLGFAIRLQKEGGEENDHVSTTEERKIATCAFLEVVENRFALAAQFPIYEGENRVGRYNDKFTPLEVAIHSTDPSMDRIHCTIYAKTSSEGDCHVYVMDENSLTGTFVNTCEIMQGEKRRLHHGDVITLGATSILFSQFSKS